MSDKRPLLLFSGGLDSTYMLRCALMETDVDVLYIDCGQCTQKIQAERVARRAILKWMHNREKLLDEDKRHYVYGDFDYKGVSYADAPRMVSSQAPVWLMGALYHFNPDIHSEVRVAYVMGDDALIYRHEMTAAWENLCLLAKGVSVPLVFPLMGWRKKNILSHIQADLLDLIWVCELPQWVGTTITPCQRCIPCKRHALEMKEAFSRPSLVKARVREAKKSFASEMAAVEAERSKVQVEEPILDHESSSDSSRLTRPVETTRSRRKPETQVRPARSQSRGEC